MGSKAVRFRLHVKLSALTKIEILQWRGADILVCLEFRQTRMSARQAGKQLRLRQSDIERAVLPALPEAEELSGFERLAMTSVADVCDNEEDAIDDNWRKLYGVKER